MSKIADTGISIRASNQESVSLVLGVDVAFSPAEVAARSSGTQFEVQCDIWDEDTFDDDWITKARKVIAPEALASVVGIDFDFNLLLKNLRTREPYHESAIEFYGELALLRKFRALEAIKITVLTTLSRLSEPPSSGAAEYDVVADANGSFVKTVGTTIHEQQRVQFDVKATGAISGASNAIVAFR